MSKTMATQTNDDEEFEIDITHIGNCVCFMFMYDVIVKRAMAALETIEKAARKDKNPIYKQFHEAQELVSLLRAEYKKVNTDGMTSLVKYLLWCRRTPFLTLLAVAYSGVSFEHMDMTTDTKFKTIMKESEEHLRSVLKWVGLASNFGKTHIMVA